METVSFTLEPFFCCWKPELKLGEINFKRKVFCCQWKPFSIFLPEEAVFPYSGNAFFNECFIRGNGNEFLASTNHKLFFRLVETYFLTNPSFQLSEKYFIFTGNRLHYLSVLSYQPKPSVI